MAVSQAANFVYLRRRYALQQARHTPTTARYIPETLTAEMLGTEERAGATSAKKVMPRPGYILDNRICSRFGLPTTGQDSPRSTILRITGAMRKLAIANAGV